MDRCVTKIDGKGPLLSTLSSTVLAPEPKQTQKKMHTKFFEINTPKKKIVL